MRIPDIEKIEKNVRIKTLNEDIIHIIIEKIKVLKQPFPSIGDLSLEITITILILIYFF